MGHAAEHVGRVARLRGHGARCAHRRALPPLHEATPCDAHRYRVCLSGRASQGTADLGHPCCGSPGRRDLHVFSILTGCSETGSG